MVKISWRFLVPFLLALVLLPSFAVSEDKIPGGGGEPWTVLPEGARPAYMGIHGGTMPVSLLVADGGACLLSFVGCTGNDFLETLRRTPSSGVQKAPPPMGQHPEDFSLFAGNATSSLPVISLSGDILSGLGSQLQPFGLSDEPLSIEGQTGRPELFPARAPRNFSLTGWLFPVRGR